jgi:hypothetical protein
MNKILNYLFGKPEEINGGNRCPTYLYRWTILKWWGKRGLYIHHFVGDDWSLDLHDHPKRFISIGLWGWYIEETPSNPDRKYHAPWIRSFPATHIHRLRCPSKNCWTLVLVLKAQRNWGFWHLGRFIGFKEYIGSTMADEMKECQ